jgi:uncharacterized protein (DUF2236 family)
VITPTSGCDCNGGTSAFRWHHGSVQQVRDALATAIRDRVAGPDGQQRARALLEAEGPRRFAEGRPIRRVHGDPAAFVGGVRALLLQSLHPLAMAGVAQHSDYRHDPWGRLQRTADFLAATTFGTVDQADEAVARVKQVHRRVRGRAADGRPYAANDPHLLLWVHLAEVDSFLAAHQAYGAQRLTPAEADAYVADTAVVARALGAERSPTSVAELRAALAAFRPELGATPEARDVARYLFTAPVPFAARGAYTVLFAAASGLLPWWARWELRLPILPVTDRMLVPIAGQALVRTMRWVLTPAPLG